MGNSSSTPVNKDGRRSNRLSKPPTDPSLLNHRRVSVAQRSEITVDPSTLNPTELQASSTAGSSVGERTPTAHDPRHERQLRPAPPSRRQSSQETGSKVRSSFGSFVGGLPDRLSRSKSALFHLPDSAPPVTEGSGTADLSTLSFVPESGPTVPDPSSQDVQERENESLHSSVTGVGKVMSPSPELLHDNQFTSGRRKSLLTPGIATRPASGHGQTLNQASISAVHSSDHDEHIRSVNTIVRPPSPYDSLPPQHYAASPQPRVSTPTQLEYSHLGGLKPGTLRIMNGYPPATPNDQAQRNNLTQLSSDSKSDESHHNLANLPPEKTYTPQLSPSGCLDDDENGLGLQFLSQANPRSEDAHQSSHHTNSNNHKEISSLHDKPPKDPTLHQYPSNEIKHLLANPTSAPAAATEPPRYPFLDSPFSFEITPTQMTFPAIDEFDNDRFEDEGVDISHRGTEEQDFNHERPENDSGQDSVSSLRDNAAQPLKKADSGYSSATSHSKRTNSRHGRIEMDTPEECESFSDKVAGWNFVDNNNRDYYEGRQPSFRTLQDENDIISQPLREHSRQLNTYHTSRSVSHLRQTENSVGSARFSRKQSVEVESKQISFRNSFSTPHLPREDLGRRTAATHHRESFPMKTPQIPLELAASCGCVLRFYNMNDSHGVHGQSEAKLTSRRLSNSTAAAVSPGTIPTVSKAQTTCMCGSPMISQPTLPSTRSPKPGKLSRRRRSSGMSGVADSTIRSIDTYSQEVRSGSFSRDASIERRQSSDIPRIRRSIGPSHQLSRPKSFASLGSQSPSEYREQPIGSREPSIWGDDTSVYSDSTGLRGRWQSPKPDQDPIPPIPPLPTNIKSKRSISEQLGLSHHKSSNFNRDSQPRKLVKPQKGSSRHPKDSRVMVNGEF